VVGTKNMYDKTKNAKKKNLSGDLGIDGMFILK
jgi:hypothetical protein